MAMTLHDTPVLLPLTLRSSSPSPYVNAPLRMDVDSSSSSSRTAETRSVGELNTKMVEMNMHSLDSSRDALPTTRAEPESGVLLGGTSSSSSSAVAAAKVGREYPENNNMEMDVREDGDAHSDGSCPTPPLLPHLAAIDDLGEPDATCLTDSDEIAHQTNNNKIAERILEKAQVWK
ncbi:hypothetical protein HK102_005034, partial [Quaeritorhiza haematococci]